MAQVIGQVLPMAIEERDKPAFCAVISPGAQFGERGAEVGPPWSLTICRSVRRMSGKTRRGEVFTLDFAVPHVPRYPRRHVAVDLCIRARSPARSPTHGCGRRAVRTITRP